MKQLLDAVKMKLDAGLSWEQLGEVIGAVHLKGIMEELKRCDPGSNPFESFMNNNEEMIKGLTAFVSRGISGTKKAKVVDEQDQELDTLSQKDADGPA